jgi:hypothetical protein
MDDDEHGHDEAGGEPPPGADQGAPGEIDIALLAAKVHKLMQDELRLEKARGATRARSW